jgi:glycosyltransferase involved in cell wall biosynthesis
MAHEINAALPRIAFIARPDLFDRWGGDSIQILETKRGLETLGCRVEVVFGEHGRDAHEAIASVDIVHCFNLLLAHQQQWLLDLPKRPGRKMVLSPIFWDTTSYERRSGVMRPWKRFALNALDALPVRAPSVLSRRMKSLAYNAAYRNAIARWLNGFDAILPNASVEVRVLSDLFGDTPASFVVTNACGTPPDVIPVMMPTMPEKFVLCVGRVEHRKNQLPLVDAAADLGLPLVLLGDVNPDEEGYAASVRNRADARGLSLVHIPHVSHDAVWLWYRGAAVHAQPSWFETPGLSSLEAASVGCPIVCTEIGSAPEYFGPDAEYCHPEQPASIRSAVQRALQRRDPERLATVATRVRERYSWTRAAEQTLAAYRAVLAAPEKEART